MANWYCDINNATVSGVGTEASPFNMTNLRNFLSSTVGTLDENSNTVYVQTNDKIYIKGNYLANSFFSLFPSNNSFIVDNVELLPWDFENNGYWKLGVDNQGLEIFPNDGSFSSSITVTMTGVVLYTLNSGYILSSYSPIIEYVKFKIINSIIYGSFNVVQKIDGCEINGCTLVNGSLTTTNYGEDNYTSYLTFNECVFINWEDNFDSEVDNIIFNYCVFDSTQESLDVNATYNLCTFSWINPVTFPDYNEITEETLTFEDYNINYNFANLINETDCLKDFFVDNNMEQGAYGSNRRGSGAFFFSNNIFYIDCDSSNNGQGTENDPLSINHIGYDFTYDNDVLRLKGTISNKDIVLSDGVILESWNPSTNGPFRIYQDNGNEIGGTNLIIKDAIFDLNTTNETYSINASYIYNSILSSTGSVLDLSLQNVKAYGCSFIFPGITYINFYNNNGGVAAEFVDCIFDMSCFCGTVAIDNDVSVVMNNCVVTPVDKISLSAGANTVFEANLSATNIQYGWVSPTWPDLSSTNKTDFSFTNLTSDDSEITIAGTEDWNDYSQGLWDSLRYNVGAFYFDHPNIIVESENILLNITPHIASISANANLIVDSALQLTLLVKEPKIYKFKDVDVDFTAEPVRGSSPLCVKFTALISFISNRFNIKEYRWYFDYDNYPSTYETYYTPIVYHAYGGMKGKQYSVRLCVIATPKV